MTAPRVAIVGGGITGLASAAALAPDHDVTLLERDAIAGDTTSRASGVISLPLEPIDDAVRTHVSDALHGLDAAGQLTYEPIPAVRLLEDDATATLGGDHHDIEALRDRFPTVFGRLDGYTGGAVLHGAGVLDPLELAMAYKREAEAHGATILRDRHVTGLRTADTEATGVDTDLGPVDADTVVWATGWRTTHHLDEHLAIPTRPLRWNALVLTHDIDATIPIGSDPRDRLYWRPYGDGALLVGGNEHLVDDPVAADQRVDPAFRTLVEQRLPDLLGVEPPLHIIREDCCPTADSASPDGLPIIDAPAEAPDGLVVATGFHGRGVMLAPATGAAVRAHCTGEAAPFPLEPYRLDRFDDRSRDFTYVSHWT